jgi:hypothetical protein
VTSLICGNKTAVNFGAFPLLGVFAYGQFYSHFKSCGLAVESTQPPAQWVPKVKGPEHDAGH